MMTNKETTPGFDQKPGEDALLEDLKQVGEQLDRSPLSTEYSELGAYTHHAVYHYFDQWDEALEAAGLKPRRTNRRSHIGFEVLLSDLDRVASDLGRAPTTTEYDEIGEFAYSSIRYYFDSWDDALREVGADPDTKEKKVKIPEDELLEELRVAAEALGRPPMKYEMDDFEYSGKIYYQRFGSWNDAVREAGLEPILKDYS